MAVTCPDWLPLKQHIRMTENFRVVRLQADNTINNG